MKKQISFEFIQERGKNFTPSHKITAWAKQNRMEISNRYFNTYVKVNGIEYTYHHYHIEATENGKEKVTIYMEEI